jgi:hypothetical protein
VLVSPGATVWTCLTTCPSPPSSTEGCCACMEG